MDSGEYIEYNNKNPPELESGGFLGIKEQLTWLLGWRVKN